MFAERLSNGDVKVTTSIIDRNKVGTLMKELADIDFANVEEEINTSKVGW